MVAIASALLLVNLRAAPPPLQIVSASPVTYNVAPSVPIPRTTEYLLDNAAVGDGQTRVRVLLPAGYPAGNNYPVVYLLHGFSGSEQAWSNLNAVNDLNDTLETTTRAADIVFVMPDGDNDFYSDWYDPTHEDRMRYWETYHIEQLIPWVEENFKVRRDRGGRAISGLSMGGFGCTTYAARHPDLFAGVFSISGAVDNRALALAGPIPFELLEQFVNLPEVVNLPADKIWGPFATEAVRWLGRNPYTLANNLRPLTVWLGTGQGVPGGTAPGDDNVNAIVLEMVVGALNCEFDQRLTQLSIPHTYLVNAQATHTGYHFLNWFKQALPVMQQTFAASPGTPESFDYQAIEPSFDIFGWQFSTHRDVLEFLYLTEVSRDGLKLKGSGIVEVATPPAYVPHQRYWVLAPGQPGIDVWPNHPEADSQGRLRFNVRLGDSHQYQQFTAQQAAVEAVSIDYWKEAAVKILR